MKMILPKRIKQTLFALSFTSLLSGSIASANNLSIKGDTVIGSTVIFTISWDNSWYTTIDNPYNWDAVWIFAKYRDCNIPGWNHVKLSTNVGDHSVGTPLKVETATDSNGVFLRRTSAGIGNISSVKCTLKLVTPSAAGTYSFRIFGLEMVSIPQGKFQLGDSASAGTFKNVTIADTSQSKGLSASFLYTNSPALPATYPMGYNLFYCMKYEITQEQYVDFLNTLTYDQQATRTVTSPNASSGSWALAQFNARNSIRSSVAGYASTSSKIPAVYVCDYNNNGVYNQADDGLNIAGNYLSWADLSAYLDWASLRPMSDIEFEKICRGTLNRYDREYIWGGSANSSSPTQAKSSNFWTLNTLTGTGTANEKTITTGDGLCAYGYNWSCSPNVSGPLRVGFAADSATTRAKAGATYYGVLDMGGNVWERIVSAATTTYTGTLGNGMLDASGNADVSGWPGTNAAGTGYRGGSWYDGASYLQVSDRTNANSTNANRECTFGGRGVR